MEVIQNNCKKFILLQGFTAHPFTPVSVTIPQPSTLAKPENQHPLTGIRGQSIWFGIVMYVEALECFGINVYKG
jgi:hypothetical protein